MSFVTWNRWLILLYTYNSWLCAVTMYVHPASQQKAFETAVEKAGITKNASVHTLRHSFATHLLGNDHDPRTIQEHMDHQNLRTTMIYQTHLTFNPDERTITVNTRKKEKPDGAWSADARWGEIRINLSRFMLLIYDILP